MSRQNTGSVQKLAILFLAASILTPLALAGSEKILKIENPRFVVKGDTVTAEANISNTGGKGVPNTTYEILFRVTGEKPQIRGFSIRDSAVLDRGDSFRISRVFTPQDLGVESIKDVKDSLGKEVSARCEKCTIERFSDVPLFEEVNGELEKVKDNVRIIKEPKNTRNLPQSVEVTGRASGENTQLNIVNGDSVYNTRFSYILIPQSGDKPVIKSFFISRGDKTVIDISSSSEIERALVCPPMGTLNSGECISSERPDDTEEESGEEENKEDSRGDEAEAEDPKDTEEKEETTKSKDRDSDGISDQEDNCPETPNPGQKDRNDNGVGDRCEEPREEKKKPSFFGRIVSSIGSWF